MSKPWLIAIACPIVLPVWASAGPVVDFDPRIGGTGINNDQSVGWSFDVHEAVTLTALSWFDQDADGLAVAHRVGIWNPAGQLVSSVTIPSGTLAALDDIWRIVPVEPFVLDVGKGYVVGGVNYASTIDRIAGGVLHQVVDPRIEYGESRYSPLTNQFVRPALSSGGLEGLYGPGFNVVGVPEPGSLTLLFAVLFFVWRQSTSAAVRWGNALLS